MPLGDRSGLQPPAILAWHKVTRAVKALLGSIEAVAVLGAHTAYTHKRGEVYLGFSNEVWFRRFLAPPFGVLFHPFPFTHFFFPLFFHVFLPSCSVISSLSFFCVHNDPALSIHVHNTLFNPGFRSPRSLQ